MRLLRIILLTFTACIVMGQTAYAQYGFDWIQFDQDYYKFKIGEEGIYRIDQQALANVGIPIASINPKNIQIFRHGQEIPIYIEGESDNNFDATDYIEFYARKNDGELDKALYRSPGEQPHDEISLMNDTAIYFLSWNNSTSNLRIVTHNDNNYAGKTSDDWIWYRSSSWFTNDFYDGSPYASPGYFTEFTEGEGWFSPYIARGVTRTFKMPTEHYNPLGPLAEYEFLLFGKSDPTNPGDIVDGLNHETQLKINGKVVFTQKFRGFKKILQRDTIAPSEIGSATTDFNFASIYLSRSRHAVSYLLVDYPRHLTLDGSSQFAWDYTGSNDYFKFSNYPNGKNQPLVYDIANNRRIIGSLTSQDLEFNRTSGANGRIVIRDQTDIISLDQFEEVSFNLVDPSNTNYDYLIITHPLLDSAAALYKQYRESQTGGGYNIHMVYTPDLYNLYYYGYHHPMALRNYLMHMYNGQSVKPEYVLLLGKGQTYNLTATNTLKRDFVDLVPTWGVPPSDYPFVTDVGVHLLNPCMAIGRIPALNNTDIVN